MDLLGLDIGGTKSAAILGREDGTVLAREEFSSHAERGPDALIADLCAAADRLGGEPAAIGVSIGGPLNALRGIIHQPPNLPGWRNIPLRDQLATHFELPVRVDHDAAACALAEARWGAGQGVARLGYLTCGTGFGIGLVIDGEPTYGGNGRSIEIGHIRYRPDGPTAFGKQGSFEAWCAGASLPRLAAWLVPERWRDQPPDGPELTRLWQSGDADAARVIQRQAQAVGDACAMLGDLLIPDRLLLGSMARYLGEPWLAWVRKRFVAEVLPAVAAHCQITAASLGDRLQDLSALAVASRAVTALGRA